MPVFRNIGATKRKRGQQDGPGKRPMIWSRAAKRLNKRAMRRVFFTLLACLNLGLSLTPVAAQDAAVVEAFDLLLAGDYDGALAMVSPLAEAGDTDAQHLLGYLYENGLGVEKDLQHAVDLYVAAGTAGQPDAQFALGEMALAGEGVRQSSETALGWYKLAARQGHARAKLRLGVMYLEGNGVEQDKVRGVEYFTDAAEAGEAEAQRNLAIAFLSGDGVAADDRKAAEWFAKSANGGDALAAYNLSLMLQSGRLGPPDLDAAAARMHQAAQADFAPAMTGLGLLLHGGAKLDGDDAGHPADWFERAAEAGDPQGRFLYAVALTQGDGREADPESAKLLVDDLLADPSVDPALKRDAEKLRKELARKH